MKKSITICMIGLIAIIAFLTLNFLMINSKNGIVKYFPIDLSEYIYYTERKPDDHFSRSGIDMLEIDRFDLTDEEFQEINEIISNNEQIWNTYSEPQPNENTTPWSVWDLVVSCDIFNNSGDLTHTDCYYSIYDYKKSKFISINEISSEFNLGLFIFDCENRYYYFVCCTN